MDWSAEFGAQSVALRSGAWDEAIAYAHRHLWSIVRKSSTFYMNILRDWRVRPPGDGYQRRTCAHRAYEHVHRLDLRTLRSGCLESVAAVFGHGELAHSIASIVVGYEPENMKVNDGTHLDWRNCVDESTVLNLPTIAAN